MTSKQVLMAIGSLGEQLAQFRKERDELAKFRAAMTERVRELGRLVKDEPEAVDNGDLIDIIKAVLIRQKKALSVLHEPSQEPQTNGALSPLAGVH